MSARPPIEGPPPIEYPFPIAYRIVGRVIGTEDWLIRTTNRNCHGIWFTMSGVKTALAHIKKHEFGHWFWNKETDNYEKHIEPHEYKIQSRPIPALWTDLDTPDQVHPEHKDAENE